MKNALKEMFKGLFLLIVIAMFLPSCGYNSLQQKEEGVFSAWGDVETNLQRRADLIPNLVSTVKAYAAHEKDTLQGVIEARAKATQTKISVDNLNDPAMMAKFSESQGMLSSALSRLMVTVEKYPNLKANENFMALQNQLEGTENRINVARQRYNKEVKTFNTAIRQFPASLTNSLMLHLDRKEYFKAAEGAQTVPTVKF